MNSARTLRPVPPADRPRRQRRTARVLMIDPQQRLLLFGDTDPGIPGSGWWITPGGGIDPGESEEQAAIREVAEETGYAGTVDDLIGPLARRKVTHGYTDVVIDQQDVFFAMRVPAFEVSDAGHTDEERITMTRHHWWTRDALAATEEIIWPANLLVLWDLADRGVDAPVELDPVDESTVPPDAG